MEELIIAPKNAVERLKGYICIRCDGGRVIHKRLACQAALHKSDVRNTKVRSI